MQLWNYIDRIIRTIFFTRFTGYNLRADKVRGNSAKQREIETGRSQRLVHFLLLVDRRWATGASCASSTAAAFRFLPLDLFTKFSQDTYRKLERSVLFVRWRCAKLVVTTQLLSLVRLNL